MHITYAGLKLRDARAEPGTSPYRRRPHAA